MRSNCVHFLNASTVEGVAREQESQPGRAEPRGANSLELVDRLGDARWQAIGDQIAGHFVFQVRTEPALSFEGYLPVEV